jgi:3-oxoacyl-[acyl-carrier protein] reductase
LAKNSIINLSKILSKKLIGKVRVNSVSPGNILFDGGTWEKKLKKNKKNVYEYIKTNVPLNRFGTAKEIANSIVFLSSDKASFINGSNLTVDGGQTSVLK